MIILLEGLDNTGKTTLAHALGRHYTKLGLEVYNFRTPGSTPIAESIRSVLKDKSLRMNEQMNMTTQALLFCAAISQSIQKIEDTLKQNPKAVIILDRWVLSTYIYQCLTGSFPYPYLYQLMQITGVSRIVPDVVVLMENTAHSKTPDDAIEEEFASQRSIMQNHYRRVMNPENFYSIFPFYKGIKESNRISIDIAYNDPVQAFAKIMELPALKGE